MKQKMFIICLSMALFCGTSQARNWNKLIKAIITLGSIIVCGLVEIVTATIIVFTIVCIFYMLIHFISVIIKLLIL